MNNIELYVILSLILFVIMMLATLVSGFNKKRKVFKNNTYAYIAKDSPMTSVEVEFFKKLNNVVNERYYVFPQVHLSAILKPNVSGSDYLYAFRHINGKSVDYVLCDKLTLRPTYAIELDDYTHDNPTRRKRDAEVERIFSEANLPLVRFKNKNIEESEIIQTLMKVNR